MSLPHRCTRCGARHTFSRDWQEFVRRKACKACGHARFFVDRWMLRRGRQQRCNCDGYWFPHRRRSLCCSQRPDGPVYQALRYAEGSDRSALLAMVSPEAPF